MFERHFPQKWGLSKLPNGDIIWVMNVSFVYFNKIYNKLRRYYED